VNERDTLGASMNEIVPNVSEVICTRNRADSLKVTLECLASANREGILAEVIVVDYAGLLLAESHLTRRLFGGRLRRIAGLPSPAR
jgi:hypothetical protein